MRVAIIGGKLQGVEAVYLAHKAGWEVKLLDRQPGVPASRLCDKFCLVDVTREAELEVILQDTDLVIPAMENVKALESLVRVTALLGIPLVFDPEAYQVSASKLASNELFARLGVPAPVPWPSCGFPIIAKPSGSSGSEGVMRLDSMEQYQAQLANLGPEQKLVIEEYLPGPSYSIEVIGYQGKYRVLQITELEMDRIYDCKRVLAPVELEKGAKEQLEEIALTLAKALELQGIMDVETIRHRGQMKVLEIDARLPSQTPTAVYWSTGINMLQLLGESFASAKPNPDDKLATDRTQTPALRGVVYEHIRVSADLVEVCGEHIMAEAGPLTLHTNFFGADEALTNYVPGAGAWVATLIITAATREQAWEKRCEILDRVKSELGLSLYRDDLPCF